MNVFPLVNTSSKKLPLKRPRLWLMLGILGVAGLVAAAPPTHAQGISESVEPRTADELQELVGPIALYPDDLVAIVLPASTYPLQVVQAARFLEDRKSNSALKPDPEWDDSVVALLNYPEVLKLLNDDLAWTWDLGEAVLNQNADVLAAVQAFRDRAYAAGNLRSDDRQVVTAANNEITIAPANPEVIYVPYYEPRRVVVYQPTPVFHYHPWAYPVYYYPYPAGYSFSVFHTGFFWGVSTAFVIGWHDHHVNVFPCGFRGHPYFGHHYYDRFYIRNNYNVNVFVHPDSHVWHPGYGRSGRPFTRSREGYVARGPNAAPPTRAPNASLDRGTRVNGRAVALRDRTVSAGLGPVGEPRTRPVDRSSADRAARGMAQAWDQNRARTSERPSTQRPTASGNTVAPRGQPPERGTTYRNDRGMSQAFERNRAPSSGTGSVMPRAPAANGSAVVTPRQPASNGATVAPRQPQDRGTVLREGRGMSQAYQPNPSTGARVVAPQAPSGNTAAPRGQPTNRSTGYRAGGGMSQALEANRAAAPQVQRQAAPAPRQAAPRQNQPRGEASSRGGGEYRGNGGGHQSSGRGSR